MNQMQRKAGRLAWLVVLLWALAANANGCALMLHTQEKRDPNAPDAVTWDLSLNNYVKNLDPYAVQKFYQRNLEAISYQDGIHLTLRLPGNRVFDEDLDTIICSRYGSDSDRVRDINVYFPPMRIEEIERMGDRLIKYWKFERVNFDDWCRERRGSIPEDDDRLGMGKSFKSGCRSEARPSLYMEIYHSQGDRWLLTWQAYWGPDDAK
jgi:hypothetical protein